MMTLYVPPRRRSHMMRYFPGDRVARNVGMHTGVHSDVQVPVDVKDEQDAFVIIATLPGLEADDLSIEILENVVDLSGEFVKDAEEDDNYLRSERAVGNFHRRLRFSSKLETDNAEASLKNGILTLRVPKVEEERPKTIKVRTK
ncbi:MAG: Hsp20/alpha crystallin family protein [Anaerolineales bacterium]|nr:Hsp20/alpha crystallin family protein [Chloroflexota bacterium]MBL6981027.1 Hsp20/alpha crystallin family protein [Anaerolineales bacterium]